MNWSASGLPALWHARKAGASSRTPNAGAPARAFAGSCPNAPTLGAASLRPVLGLGLRHPGLELLDAGAIIGVGAQKDRRAAAASLLDIRGESFPKRHRLLRVVAGARHVDQPAMVCFGFLVATMRQFHAY